MITTIAAPAIPTISAFDEDVIPVFMALNAVTIIDSALSTTYGKVSLALLVDCCLALLIALFRAWIAAWLLFGLTTPFTVSSPLTLTIFLFLELLILSCFA